ncbi:MAG TPA: DNA-3-methyladenine glycosylase 2 family protein [Coriobacteriia bacterium]|nr:DNA-3-methyladenine glycosylase 2 family protein [Coriobacteriia bacterium]
MAHPALILTSSDSISRQLAGADPSLGELIDRIGRVQVDASDPPFVTLARAIVSQQLSDKIASIIWGRVLEVAEPTPEALASATTEALRSAGLSRSKVDYIQGVARAFLNDEIDADALELMTDDEVVAELTRLRGVGRWTAEMFLIFGLRRPDVLALDDYGVRLSAGRMLGLERAASRDELAERGARWAPHRTAASLWLWSDLG